MREIRAFPRSQEQFLANDKKTGILLHLQGHEFCEPPGSLEEDPKCQRRTVAPADPSFQSGASMKGGPSQTISVPLNHKNCDIDVCIKLLHLW